MSIVCFAGGPVLSDFRIDRLNTSLRAANEAELLDSRELFAIEFAGEPTPAQLADLARLLAGQPVPDAPLAPTQRLVVPRQGTVSPWSSKATDIARRCHFDGVVRIEHGRLLRFGDAPGARAEALIHDRMTEQVLDGLDAVASLFEHAAPRPLRHVPVAAEGAEALARANGDWGLALSAEEIDYLAGAYGELGRDPTDAELMMFAQANSEHCRHKIFNASWTVDGEDMGASLFGMIQMSHAASPAGVLTAYSDNAAVIEGHAAERFYSDPDSYGYRTVPEPSHVMIKVETHNHPTAISPYPGAATGSGGEIRDEAATGRGGKPKAGLAGFSVSHLRIPGHERPWEGPEQRPERLASPLAIMTEGPVGAASFNNEFGRPALGGYFRTFEQPDPVQPGLLRGYHKPIMIAGGMGAIRPGAVRKNRLSPGDHVIVLGGPAMLIGLGGGAASSMASGTSTETLDYASVQRDNPEMQRRCQEVIDRCWALGDDNPVVSIHDVGAGGLSNAIPELLDDSERGGGLDLRRIPAADTGLSPMEIWCNESQERYVLGVGAAELARFEAICERERCPYAVLGQATAARSLRLDDDQLGAPAVDLPLEVLFGNPPKMHRNAVAASPVGAAAPAPTDFAATLDRVLTLPAVGSKKFLITIGDRSVGGLTHRDQMVGPWQVPVADAAVTLADFAGFSGEAMAMGERTPLAVLDGPASGRMAVGEALTNLLSAPIASLGAVKLSANWMAAAGADQEDAALYRTVRAVGEELCPALGIAIPVGKDSLSMQTVWSQAGERRRMTAPLSLIVSAFASVADVRGAWTPELVSDPSAPLFLLDLGHGRQRLGGSACLQVHGELTGDVPDLERPEDLIALCALLARLRDAGAVLAYHDRSDGGLTATLLEMAFAARCGLDVHFPAEVDPIAFGFAEELGVVLQVGADQVDRLREEAEKAGLGDCLVAVGRPRADDSICVMQEGVTLLEAPRDDLERRWADTSFGVQAQRDHPTCAREEYDAIGTERAVLRPHLTFDLGPLQAAPAIGGARPRVAILREQGVNGHIEMAAAFDRAGFEAVDVHMSDLTHGRQRLDEFRGLVACGGFSYGDVLGAGNGWARAILFRDELRQTFSDFFADPGRFALGVCNGCQALAALAEIIPGTADWPRFVRNRSEQFEARLSLVEVLPSPSLFLAGMAGSRLPVVVSHGEGRAEFAGDAALGDRASLRYVDGSGAPAVHYPENPNGSPDALAGLANADGRVTIMMPHPERVFRTAQFSWAPADWPAWGPWLQMFVNARRWLEDR
ncbi:MAG: phosphoribosylformylglycinamidine synthase [Pseudomonadota bacterium]